MTSVDTIPDITIGQALSRRQSRQYTDRHQRRCAAMLRAVAARYHDATPAEHSAYVALRRELRREFLRHFLGRQGRPIALMQLLAQQRDNTYRWALVDPRQPIGGYNRSSTWSHTSLLVGGVEVPLPEQILARYQRKSVIGMPALPAEVRKIIRGPLMRHAKLVGVLYQPEEWMRAAPDPALIVEWACRPKEYYALAVWGGDRSRIMEFVD